MFRPGDQYSGAYGTVNVRVVHIYTFAQRPFTADRQTNASDRLAS